MDNVKFQYYLVAAVSFFIGVCGFLFFFSDNEKNSVLTVTPEQMQTYCDVKGMKTVSINGAEFDKSTLVVAPDRFSTPDDIIDELLQDEEFAAVVLAYGESFQNYLKYEEKPSTFVNDGILLDVSTVTSLRFMRSDGLDIDAKLPVIPIKLSVYPGGSLDATPESSQFLVYKNENSELKSINMGKYPIDTHLRAIIDGNSILLTRTTEPFCTVPVLVRSDGTVENIEKIATEKGISMPAAANTVTEQVIDYPDSVYPFLTYTVTDSANTNSYASYILFFDNNEISMRLDTPELDTKLKDKIKNE